MSIQIDMVHINGFQVISNMEKFLPRVALLLGQNNTVKTSLIKRLQLAVD